MKFFLFFKHCSKQTTIMKCLKLKELVASNCLTVC